MTGIIFASDHAGYDFKQQLIEYTKELKSINSYVDCGTSSTESVDYPDYVHRAIQLLEKSLQSSTNSNTHIFAVLICGSANGVSMTANKYPFVRSAICWTPEVAVAVRAHNDANVLCIPARFTDITCAKNILKTFLETQFEGGRHKRRIHKIPISLPISE